MNEKRQNADKKPKNEIFYLKYLMYVIIRWNPGRG